MAATDHNHPAAAGRPDPFDRNRYRLRHPEWVEMHRRGITPAVIARLNRVPRTRVRKYLGLARQRYPELYADQLMLHDRPRSRPEGWPDRDRRWKARLAQLVAFLDEHGRRPYDSDYNTAEGKLTHWLKTQRYDHQNGELPGHRARWLTEALPNWQQDTRALHYEAQWRHQLVHTVALRDAYGRFPRYSGDEAPLAHWLQTQRRREREGTLNPERADALDRHLPGWR